MSEEAKGSGDPPPTQGGPPAAFQAELAEAFCRLRPQGSARWNFSDAFSRLEARFGGPAGGAGTGPAPGGGPLDVSTVEAPAAGQLPPPDHNLLHRLVDRHVARRLRPWIEERARVVARQVAGEALDREMARVAEGFDATLEAFRFLSARLEPLEDGAARRREPVDAVAWLVPPPALGPWAGPVAGWLGGPRPAGPVLVGECGDGALAGALDGAGVAHRGAEPRGQVAWQAAGRGVDVHVGEVAELLAALPPGSLGGAVLAGVVDRVPLEDLVALVALATDRLGGGAPVVVVGTRPDVAVTGRDAVARDLLPGRPLHPETWELLLGRAGYGEVGRLVPPAGTSPDTYAVRGRRPS